MDREEWRMIRKYKIRNRFRFTMFLTLTILMGMIISNILIGFNQAESLTKTAYAQIQVEYGDTIWELAREFGPINIDTRKVVREIYSLNEIRADELYPGQVILIPQSL